MHVALTKEEYEEYTEYKNDTEKFYERLRKENSATNTFFIIFFIVLFIITTILLYHMGYSFSNV